MKSFRRLLLPTALGIGYSLLDWYLNGDKPFEVYLRNTLLLSLVAFIIQYYRKRKPGENLQEYIRKSFFSVTVELTIEQTLAERVNTAWVTQYLNSVRHDVTQFKVSSTFYESKNSFIKKGREDILNNLPYTSFSDYSSVAKRIFGSKPKLIITGDRGSGKTVMMMHILEVYTNHALSKNGQRNNIPVVLNMSTIPSNSESWSALFRRNKLTYKIEPHLKFEAWIIDQVKLNYKIHYQDLESMTCNNQIIYFFDGIDDLSDEYNFRNTNLDQKDESINHINDIATIFNSYVDYIEASYKKRNLSDSKLSYVIACRRSTLNNIDDLGNIRGVISLEPLSTETIKLVLTRNDSTESQEITHENYYPDSLYNYMFDSSNEVHLERKGFALEMAKNPYLLTVMRKIVKMRKPNDFELYDRWFSNEQKFKFNLLDDYINDKLNSKAYTGTEFAAQFPNKEKNFRWLTNMSGWTNSSEFILEDLQPFKHIDIRYSVFPSIKLITYWSLYVLPVLTFMLLIIALPVGISIFYEWNFYQSYDCLDQLLSRDILSKSVFNADLCKPGIIMGIKSFLWTSLVLIFTIPIAFIFGSMRLSGYYQEGPKKFPKIAQIRQKIIPQFINRSIDNRGFRFAILLAFALAATRFVLIKHSFNSATEQVFDTHIALTNFIATFLGCTVLFMLFTASNLLSEDLYIVNRFDHYKIEFSRAIYAIMGGIGVTIIMLLPIFFHLVTEYEIEKSDLVVGRALAFGGVLTICLPLLFSFKPVSDKKIKTKPNHGIRQHFKNSAISFVILFIAGTLIIYFAYDMNVKPPSGIVNAICGISFGVLSLMYGFLSVCKHYAIRMVLALPFEGESKFPFQATSFLKHMSLTGLVRIVGGRYMFEHSLLMEYFSNKNKGNQST
jgi:hypothetical protein